MREVIPSALAGERIDRVVAMMTNLSRASVAHHIETGSVLIAGKPVLTRSHRVSEHDVVDVSIEDSPDELLAPDSSLVVPVVKVDDDFVVVDKPADLIVHPGAGHGSGTLIQGLLAEFPEIAVVGDAARPGVVHRLDRGTSGLLVVARTQLAYTSLVAQLKSRTVSRHYLTLVWGNLDSDAGAIDAPIGRALRERTRMAVSSKGREAITNYMVRRRFAVPAPSTLLECRLETGRTHQIRVHLSAIGHPVVGDRRYRGNRNAVELERPFLHAFSLSFDHPRTGERVDFESPLPQELEDVISQLS